MTNAEAQSVGVPIVNFDSLPERLTGSAAPFAIESLANEDASTQAKVHAALAHIELVLKEATTDPDVLAAPADAMTARFQSFVAEQARQSGQVEPLLPGGHAVKFSRDEWAKWAFEFVRAWITKEWNPHGFLPPPAAPEQADDQLRLALFSDWGTGLYGAPHISEAIANEARAADYVIHLGDVYYTGFDNEIALNLVADWPKGGAVGRALNGNHEMYSGGGGYFSKALPALAQPSSVFAIQNNSWLVVGLDSAYDDWDLGQGQVNWLNTLLAQAGSRRLVLLTHHQPFSNTSSEQGPKLQAKLAQLLHDQRIFAWYWGHEHICAIYDKHPLWSVHGRCIGNGGMPEVRKDYRTLPAEKTAEGVGFYRLPGVGMNPSCLALDGPNEWIIGHEEKYVAHGYLTIDINGGHLTETYRDSRGKELHAIELA